MKAIYFDGKNIEYKEDCKKPIPKKGESLVRVLIGAICNTDKEIKKGYRPDFIGVMGHEFVGVVEESAVAELIGKRVVGELNSICGECMYCKSGRKTHCSNRKVLGIHEKDGCFAEYMTIDTTLLHLVPDSLCTEDAIYCEPLAAAFQITEQLGIKTDGIVDNKDTRNVAVLGDGRLAFCIAQVMALTGLPVTVIGKHQEKLEQFQGFATTALQGEPESYEIVVEATGSTTGIETALQLVQKKGIVVQKSTYAEKVYMDLSKIVVNEITIMGSRCGPFLPAIHALEEGKVHFPSITLFDLKDYKQAFEWSGFKAGFAINHR